MTGYVQLSTTTPTAEVAEQIALALIEQRLAACVQIVPHVRSVYRWEGKVEQADEWICLVKTRHELLPQIEAEIGRRHPYDCPEVIAVDIAAGSVVYLKWLEAQLASE